MKLKNLKFLIYYLYFYTKTKKKLNVNGKKRANIK